MKRFIIVFFIIIFVFPACSSLEIRTEPVPANYVSSLEKLLHELINKERVKHGIKPLVYSEKLSEIARAHSKDMINRDYFSHISPDGLGPDKRAKNAGFEVRKALSKTSTRIGVAENIYNKGSPAVIYKGVKTYSLKELNTCASEIVAGWMSSPGHRGNILNPSFEEAGIGAAMSDILKIKVTQVFF